MHPRCCTLLAVGFCTLLLTCQPPALGQGALTVLKANQTQRLPDPRFRAPFGVWEIDRVASMLAKASERRIFGKIVVNDNIPLARIYGPLEAGEIHINSRAAQHIPPNSWAFVIGHEFAHRTHGLGFQGQTNPELEFQADVAGAEYALRAGFDLAAHIAWTLSRQTDHRSPTHGSPHERAKRLGTHFGIHLNTV